MFSENLNYFNEFLLQTPETGVRAFSDLMQVRSSMAALNNPTITKLYKFLDLLAPVLAARTNTANPLLPALKTTWAFFDADLVKQFIANPSIVELVDAVSEEVLMITAANGCNPFTEDPLSPYELGLFIAKQLKYYSDDLMLATLRTTMLGKDSLDNVPMLLTILAESAANYTQAPPTMFDWDAALVWAMMLHTVWFYFSALQTKDQEMLMKYFFYQSIVAGVPVRDRMVEMISADAAGEANKKWMYTVLNQSQELVPVTTGGSQLRPFSAVWSQVGGSFVGGTMTVLAEDEQARKIYAGQENREVYVAWMREMFHITHMLQQGKL